MLTHTKGFADGTDTGPADSSSYIPGAPDDRLAAFPSFDANAGGASGASAPGSGDGSPPGAGGPIGGGSTPKPSFFDLAGAADSGSSSSPPSKPGAGDPLTAFLDGLRGLSSDAGLGGASSLPVGGPGTLLSNGLNADAGVAQLVSALASVHDGNAAFNATPFATSGDRGLDGVIAPASQ